MNTWFTSDMHLGHFTSPERNIIKYCDRPFKDADHMNDMLIKNWNSRVKEDDVVYHIGDFCFKNHSGGRKLSAVEYEKLLNGKVIHITGNHDKNNGVKSASVECAIMEFGNRSFFLTHIPPQHRREVPDFIDVVLCGHVHEKWAYKFLDEVLMLNVGVDVRKFMPMSKKEVIVECDKKLPYTLERIGEIMKDKFLKELKALMDKYDVRYDDDPYEPGYPSCFEHGSDYGEHKNEYWCVSRMELYRGL